MLFVSLSELSLPSLEDFKEMHLLLNSLFIVFCSFTFFSHFLSSSFSSTPPLS